MPESKNAINGGWWTKADSRRLHRWVAECEHYIRRCPLCGQWGWDIRTNECGGCAK
jgi:hypothetical protein